MTRAGGDWNWREGLRRGIATILFCQIERRILGALLGLNRIYLAHPGFKWLNETVAAMKIAPADLGYRLKQVFLLSPKAGVAGLHGLLEETITLAETHLPGIDLTRSREVIRHQRPVLKVPSSSF